MCKRFPALLLTVTLLVGGCHAPEMPAPSGEERPAWLPKGGFEWVKSGDVSTRASFLRNFGVGYSYDAVRGSFCDWRDIRCQVVNRGELERLQEDHGEIMMMVASTPSVRTHTKFSYSKRDYIANVQLDLAVRVNLGLYNKEKRRRQYFIEDGVEESFFYTLDETITKVDAFISDGNVLFYYELGYESVLTDSFVNAVLHLEDCPAGIMAPVDSFLNVYGTHVITEAWLGGRIRVDMQNHLWRYKDFAKEGAWTSDEFIDIATGKGSKDGYTWVEEGRLNINAWGGDQSSLTGLLGEHNPDGNPNFSTAGISAWRTSLVYDPDHEVRSNLEMVDMRLRPIWEFAEVISPYAASLIKMAATKDAALQQELLGNANFFDVAFPIRYGSASCKWHINTNSWNSYTVTEDDGIPLTVNIESGGRYVASVCHEQIDGRDLWVCYPVYEGRINQLCGLGVDESNAVYKVQWLNDKAVVTLVEGEVAADRFYITAGEVCVNPTEGVTYAESHPMAYVELNGGVLPDGAYHSELCRGFKWGQQFYVMGVRGDALVGYEAAPELGPMFFRRKENYVYIYNPNEIRYD